MRAAAKWLGFLLVAGGIGWEAAARDEALLAWLRAIAPKAQRFGSICTGALILGAAVALAVGCGESVPASAPAISAAAQAATEPAAFDRLAGTGCELVTTEMVLFEWLRSADHPDFREIHALIK